MRLSSLVKLCSLPVLALVACIGGCVFVDDSSDSSGDTTQTVDNQPDAQPATVTIDPDAKITVTPGDGVGVFVQYATGGHWTITTACDTNTSQASCNFDIFVASADPKSQVTNAQGVDLAGRDTISTGADGSVHLQTETATGLNGMTFDAPEGTNVEVELYLDAQLQERFFYWVGDGILHTGAPTIPVDFQPNIPAPAK